MSERRTGIRSFDDLKLAKKPIVFGALGNLTPTAMVPLMLASHGLPVRVVAGYVSSARIIVALEQGEVDGYFTVESTFGLREELVDKKLIVPILQNTQVHAGLPLVRDVLPRSDWPLLTVVMAMETFGLPVIGPPNMPASLLRELRTRIHSDVRRRAISRRCREGRLAGRCGHFGRNART